MSRQHAVSIAIYKRHLRLYRYLNDAWIFSEQMLPGLKERAQTLRGSKSKAKKPYKTPKKDGWVTNKRRDFEIGDIYMAQATRGIFENNIVFAVSRVEAFVEECMTIAIKDQPKKLVILADKNGVPLDIVLEHEDRDDILDRYIAMRCEGLMFGKPTDYMKKVGEVLSIELDPDFVADYVEIKASRDIIVHNLGEINSVYEEKAGAKKRGNVGDELTIDRSYFKHVVVTAKLLSGAIQRDVEAKYG